MLLIDNGIEKMALKLQQRQNLSHIEFLKVRLGMQVVVINSFKAVVTYGLALLLNIFLYTLIVHLTFLALRGYSHGAHAKTSMLCHVQNIASLIYMIVFALGCYIFSFIIITLFNKLKTSWLYINKFYLIVLSLFLASGFLIFFSLLNTTVGDLYEFRNFGIIYFISFSVFAILIIATTLTIEREINYKRKKQELDDYYKYTVQIEKINNKMRKFRHDYTNILLTMSEYLREDDLEGLKQYYHEHISPLKSEFESNTMRLNGIENLKVREIKGLITTKILQAQENNIEITVEVADEITQIDMDAIQLSRVLGIIMDNAIEASNTIEDPIIQIAFIKTDASVMIIIMNKAPKDMPKLHTLFQDGFSTKGNNRGIGLTTLKEIIDQTDNVFLDTTIENHYFIQKLEIMNDYE